MKKHREQRIVDTCMGQFWIEEALAISVGDDRFWYVLPNSAMSDEEIREFFQGLREFEQ